MIDCKVNNIFKVLLLDDFRIELPINIEFEIDDNISLNGKIYRIIRISHFFEIVSNGDGVILNKIYHTRNGI